MIKSLIKVVLVVFIIEQFFIAFHYWQNATVNNRKCLNLPYSKFKVSYGKSPNITNVTSVSTVRTQNNYATNTPLVTTSAEHTIEELRYYYLFIFIISRVESKIRRQVIRETWLKKDNLNSEYPIGHMFVIGKYGLEAETLEELEAENRIYGDILALDHQIEDKYEYLSHKVLHAITWIGENMNATFVMKADDDVYIDLEILLEKLSKDTAGTKYAVSGYIITGVAPLKDGKWAEKNWFYCKNYFPYPIGVGYIMSAGVVNFIKENHKWLKSYKNDDVSIGSWLAPTKTKMQQFNGMEPNFKEKTCQHWWIMHGFSDEQLKTIYEGWIANHTLCS